MARPKGVKESKPRKPRECSVTKKLLGNKYGRLTVLSILEKGNKPRIEVKCDCGVVKSISAYDITKRKVVSCGCYHREEMSKRQIKANNESAKRKLYNQYKLGARAREILFELTFNEVYELSTRNCYYCDTIPTRDIVTIGGIITVNGIDRVDNNKGYIESNCVPCCSTCNLKKREVTKEIILKAAEFFNEK